MKEVELGKVWLPDTIVASVEKHKQNMLEACEGSDAYDLVKKASFSVMFSDYLLKYGYALEDFKND